MNLRITPTLVALTLAAGAAAGAHAEGVYVGGALSAPNYTDSVNGFGSASGGRGPGLKLYGGYQLTPNFAVEAGYANLGRTDSSGGGQAKGQGVFLDGVGSYEFAPRWSVLGSVGVADVRFDTPAGKDSSPALKLGVGLQYDLNKTTALRVGYDQYRFSDAYDAKPQVGQTMVGVKVAF